MAVYVVRHGCAGDKQEWSGPDDDRPLDEAGVAQAAALAATLATAPIGRILTSPARRCYDSVVPLGHRLDLAIEAHDGLRVDAAHASVEDLLAAVAVAPDGGPGTVLCTHGEVMRRLLAALRKAETPFVTSDDDDDWLLAKGTAWRLALDAPGHVAALAHIVPEERRRCPTHP